MTNEEILKRVYQERYDESLDEAWLGWEEELAWVMEAMERAKNLQQPDVKHQLIAYQKWCYEHPEYDQVTETPRVELYLKAINCA